MDYSESWQTWVWWLNPTTAHGGTWNEAAHVTGPEGSKGTLTGGRIEPPSADGGRSECPNGRWMAGASGSIGGSPTLSDTEGGNRGDPLGGRGDRRLSRLSRVRWKSHARFWGGESPEGPTYPDTDAEVRKCG